MGNNAEKEQHLIYALQQRTRRRETGNPVCLQVNCALQYIHKFTKAHGLPQLNQGSSSLEQRVKFSLASKYYQATLREGYTPKREG